MAQDGLRVVVIGFNNGGGDDNVGAVVISELQTVPPQGCELRTLEGGLPPAFLAEFTGGALIIFVDSIQSTSPPGTVHCLKLPSKSVRPRHLDLEAGLALQIEERKREKGSVPRMFLIGVEVAPGATTGELSQETRKAVGEIVRNFPRYLKLARDLTA